MDMERKERRKSIRAARDWLLGAEHAIAGEDDLAGDLKVMLARAELARVAAPRRERLRRWLRWILPPLAAAAVWAAVSLGQHPLPETAQHAAPSAAVKDAAQQIEPRAPVAATPAPEAQPADAGADAYATEAPPPAQVQPRAQETQADAQQHALAAAPQPEPQTSEISHIPNRDMQRLMQVGGKILRE